MPESREMEKEKDKKEINSNGYEDLGDDDEFDVPLFCVDKVTLIVIMGVVIALSVLVWKVIL